MGGGNHGTTTTTAYNLPTEAGAFAQDYLERANAITNEESYNDFFAVYSNDTIPVGADPTYAPFQSIDGHYPEKEGIVALANRISGNTTVNKGKTFIQDVLDGDFLEGTHSGFTTMLDDATGKPTTTFTNDVRPKLGASLYLIGDLSGENIAYTLSASLASRYTDRAIAGMKHANYQEERQTQHGISRVVPVYAEEIIRDAEASHRAGLRYRVWLHGKYTADYEMWQDAQTNKLRRAEVLGNAIRSLVGSQTTRTEPYHRPSPVAGMAAGAASGAMAGSSFGPWGTAIGAVVGAGLGYAGSQ